jgi:hypothetical protein
MSPSSEGPYSPHPHKGHLDLIELGLLHKAVYLYVLRLSSRYVRHFASQCSGGKVDRRP